MLVENCVIFDKKNIANGIFDITVECPKIASEAVCGQFVDVKCNGFTLRRPISICSIDKKKGLIRLVFQIRGEGTDWLSQKCKGETLDILGPLGNGFHLKDQKTLLIGGGIGVPPMYSCAEVLGKKSKAILGFRNEQLVILEDDFRKLCSDVLVCTDDGSYGYNGTVIKPLEKELAENPPEVVLACGPRPMLKAIAEVCDKASIKCFVSMEQRMACGVGACLTCAIKVRINGKEKYLHVCKNGPVFDAKTIVW